MDDIGGMKQPILGKREFLDQMSLVAPWAERMSLIAPHAPATGAKGGRPPFARREHHSSVPPPARSPHLSLQILTPVNATLAAKGLLLKSGTVVDATLIDAPSSTKKGNPWHFGTKAHIGVDADSGLVHTVVGTAANVNGHVAMRPGKH